MAAEPAEAQKKISAFIPHAGFRQGLSSNEILIRMSYFCLLSFQIMSTQITLDFPSDIFLALNKNEVELKRDIKISFATSLYLQHKLTIGKAAQMAGLSRLEFENFLSENNIPISNLNLDDVKGDMGKLR